MTCGMRGPVSNFVVQFPVTLRIDTGAEAVAVVPLLSVTVTVVVKLPVLA
jgi:hypothetical protein